jgi:hypothetical protein
MNRAATDRAAAGAGEGGDRRREVVGGFALEAELLAGDGVDEAQHGRVQGEPRHPAGGFELAVDRGGLSQPRATASAVVDLDK